MICRTLWTGLNCFAAVGDNEVYLLTKPTAEIVFLCVFRTGLVMVHQYHISCTTTLSVTPPTLYPTYVSPHSIRVLVVLPPPHNDTVRYWIT